MFQEVGSRENLLKGIGSEIMQKEGKIGPYEAISLITITICSKVLLSSPRELIALVGTAGWYASLVETLTAIIAFIFIYFLMKRFPGKGLVEVSEIELGKVLGIIGMMVLAIVFYIKGVLYCRELVEALKAFEYPMTPSSFFSFSPPPGSLKVAY
jgi:spore germination protein KB